MREASVVICAYMMDRWTELKDSVVSVRRQTIPPKEVFLVIDYNDTLQRRAETEIAGGIVRVVANKYGRGLSGGRRTGAELASGEVIVFLDDDAVAEPDWLEPLLNAYDDSQVLGSGGAIQPNWQRRPSWFPPEFNWVVGCTYDGMPVGPDNRLRNPIGASMSVRTDVFRTLGGFASELGRREGGGAVLGVVAESCEETEFAIRASRLFPGGIWRYCPGSRVHHLVPVQRSTWRFFIRRCRMEGRAKAVLTTLAGPRDSLGSERRYVVVLGRSFMRDLVMGRVRRAGAIFIGLAVTTLAYANARLAARKKLATTGLLGAGR
jgi:glycosyltransferase involved in cell wall biosynthesis